MTKLLFILLLLFGCSPTEPEENCENGSEYSEFGYYCDDLSVIQDIININPGIGGSPAMGFLARAA